MDWVNFVSGLLFLFAGRKLFWLFVGIMGFLAGMQFGFDFFAGQSRLVVLIFSSCIGVLGAILAWGFQWAAVILTGFLGGGYFLMNGLTFLGLGTESAWLIFLIGGICGVLIAALIFDWALIGLTSLAGAMLITQSLGIVKPAQTIFFIICAAIGITLQAYFLTGTRKDV